MSVTLVGHMGLQLWLLTVVLNVGCQQVVETLVAHKVLQPRLLTKVCNLGWSQRPSIFSCTQ